MTQRKFGKSWWVDFSHDGVRYRKKSPLNTIGGAKRYEAHLRSELAKGHSVFDSEKRIKQSQSFEAFVWTWFNTHVLVNNKPSEITRKRRLLKSQLIPFFGRTPINEISKLQIEKYKSRLAGSGLSNKTINNYLTILNTCLRHASEWLELTSIPTARLLKTPPNTYDFLTVPESKQLLLELGGMWYDIVLLALRTGLRLGELRALRWQDINWYSKTLSVNHSWCKVTRSLLSPKSNKRRTVPLTQEVLTMLSKRKAKTDYVFASARGKPFDDVAINREIREACSRAGLRVITCHVLRHTFASHLALAGVPVIAIQQLLGHSSIEITMRYAHLSRSSLDEAIAVLEGPDFKERLNSIQRQPVGKISEESVRNSDSMQSDQGIAA